MRATPPPETREPRSPHRAAQAGERPWLRALLALFLVVLACRLNRLHLLLPDGPDYVVLARSLATGAGYRNLDQPGEPRHGIRPPGMALLLAPAALARPLDAGLAKLSVAALGLASLVLLDRLGRRDATRRASLLAAALFLTSPYTVLFSTEVMSEVPYALVSLLILDRLDRPPGGRGARRARIAELGLLAFLPLLRTQGVAMVAALGVVSLGDPRHRRWLVPALGGAVSSAAWILWSRSHATSSYLDQLAADAASWGLRGTALNAVLGGMYAGGELLRLLAPGLLPGNPTYWRVLPEGGRIASGPTSLYAAGAMGLILLGVAGMLRRRRGSGLAALLYVVFSAAAVAFWPHRHERFSWPLVPVLLAYLPGGLAALGTRLEGSLSRLPLARRGSRVLGAAAAAALLAWQSSLTASLLGTNLRWLLEPSSFHAARSAPCFYYADWDRAGRWLLGRTSPETRVLTRSNALFPAARRYQFLVRFEELPPRELHRALARFGARYLVVPGRRFPEAFPWQLVGGDPAFRLHPVLEAGDVSVLEVGPNRPATVTPVAWPDETALAQADESARSHPGSSALRLSLALLELRRERPERAARVLESLVERRVRDLEVYALLGSAYLAAGRAQDAVPELRRALPLAGVGGGARGAVLAQLGRARERLGGPPGPRAPARVEERCGTAGDLIGSGAWERALAHADRILEVEPGAACALALKGEILTRFGQDEEALWLLEEASRGCSPRAARLLDVARREQEVAAALGPAAERRYLELARAYRELGLAGASLAALERGAARLPDSRALRLALASRQLDLGLVEAASATVGEIDRRGGRTAPALPAIRSRLAALSAGPR